MDTRNVVLIGFMGTGKSSVGKALAKRMNRVCVDIDHLIEETEKRKITDIFEREGEAYFRRIEKDTVKKVAAANGQIITTGGGVVLDPENMQALKKNGLIIALTSSAETIFQRVKDSRHRPLLKGDKKEGIHRLLEQRRPLYEKADMSFATDGKTAAQVAVEIAESLEKEEFEFGKDWF